MPELVGTTLESHNKDGTYRYFLRRLVGSGAMADVYEAFDQRRAIAMAVKVLRRDVSRNPRFKQAFEKEAGILRQLQHPNIVRLYDFAQDGDVLFIVMAWVDGKDLKNKLSQHRGPFSLDEVSVILGPVASALGYAHQMKPAVYHCDVKPANILLQNRGGEVLLTDFGVARFASEGARGGTVPYMAPEQFTREAVSPRTDVYALGVTVYQMLSGGQVPFTGNSQSPGPTTRDKIIWEHINLRLPDLRQYNPGLSRPVLAVVEKALKKDPGQRYSTVLEFSGAFEETRGRPAEAGDVYETSVLPQPPRPAPPVKSSLPVPPPVKPPPPPAPPRPREPEAAPRRYAPYLYCRSGERAGQVVLLQNQSITIGRGAHNHVHLHEPSVSRRHASIIRTRHGIFIRDENSRLGTWVNGQQIQPGQPVLLNHGDIIQTGYDQFFEFRVK